MSKSLTPGIGFRAVTAMKGLERLLALGICALLPAALLVACSTPQEALRRAIDEGNTTRVTAVLRDDYSSKSPQWALGEAASLGRNDIVKVLLDSGVDVNGGSPTALMLAAQNGHLDVVKSIVGHGADLNKQQDAEVFSKVTYKSTDNGQRVATLHFKSVPAGGKSALTYAILGKHPAVVKYLLEKGATYDKPQVYRDAGSAGFPAIASGWNTTVTTNAQLVRPPLTGTPEQIAKSLGDPEITAIFKRLEPAGQQRAHSDNHRAVAPNR